MKTTTPQIFSAFSVLVLALTALQTSAQAQIITESTDQKIVCSFASRPLFDVTITPDDGSFPNGFQTEPATVLLSGPRMHTILSGTVSVHSFLSRADAYIRNVSVDLDGGGKVYVSSTRGGLGDRNHYSIWGEYVHADGKSESLDCAKKVPVEPKPSTGFPIPEIPPEEFYCTITGSTLYTITVRSEVGFPSSFGGATVPGTVHFVGPRADSTLKATVKTSIHSTRAAFGNRHLVTLPDGATLHVLSISHVFDGASFKGTYTLSNGAKLPLQCSH